TVDLVPQAKPVRFRVVLSDARGVDHTLHDRVVDIHDHAADRRWFDVRASLAEFGGRHATVTFEATLVGDPAARAVTTALFSAPRISRPMAPGDVSVLLVTIDCLRADHVGSYGYRERTTPTIDRLAAQGIRFAESYAAASTTGAALSQ